MPETKCRFSFKPGTANRFVSIQTLDHQPNPKPGEVSLGCQHAPRASPTAEQAHKDSNPDRLVPPTVGWGGRDPAEGEEVWHMGAPGGRWGTAERVVRTAVRQRVARLELAGWKGMVEDMALFKILERGN